MTDAPLLDFRDGKEPEAFRTIGEVAKAFNLRQHVLRYWEEQFPMLRPLTRAGGRRYYRPEDVALIAEISRLLYQEGFTIRGARQALADRVKRKGADQAGAKPVPAEPAAPANTAVADVAWADGLRAIRDRLAAALQD
jgi:DNA-binding transcriptional MerR regulator